MLTRRRTSLLSAHLCLVVLTAAPSCAERDTAPANPKRVAELTFHPKETVAYVSGHHISVYMVANEKVVLVNLPLAKKERKEVHTVVLGKNGASAILYRGKGVWTKVHPGGDGPGPRHSPEPEPGKPPVELYKEEAAVAGKVLCGNIPAARTYSYHGDTAILLREVDVVFPSGRVRVSTAMRLVLRAFPP